MTFDIFLSYRRKTGANDARLLQQALKARGYNVFFDYDSLRDGQFDTKIFEAIDEALIFILMLTEGSLDNCINNDDWVRTEIEYALKQKRKIVPVADAPSLWSFPDNLPETLIPITNEQISELNKTSLFEESVDRIIKDRFPADLQKWTEIDKAGKSSAIFKFYSNENCQILLEGNEIGNLQGMSNKPFCYPVKRKGTYRFTIINSNTNEIRTNDEHIDADEEKILNITWPDRKPITTENRYPYPDNYQKLTLEFEKFLIRVYANDKISIGRFRDNDIALVDWHRNTAYDQFPTVTVSRHHAILYNEGGRLVIENLSRGGILVNNGDTCIKQGEKTDISQGAATLNFGDIRLSMKIQTCPQKSSSTMCMNCVRNPIRSLILKRDDNLPEIFACVWQCCDLEAISSALKGFTLYRRNGSFMLKTPGAKLYNLEQELDVEEDRQKIHISNVRNFGFNL
ncbi:MAG: TIR domain-containing protein [Lentisphaeria bacterium]|nr:TIR domain-containing protein [Lentisphaeria bacterium]